MIADPGRPFSRSFADLIADMQTRLTTGVEMPASASFTYQEGVGAVDLPPDLIALTLVWAQVGKRTVTCQPGCDNASGAVVGGDYVTRGSKLVWRAVNSAQDTPETLLLAGMTFTLEYTVRGTPSGVNDFLPGSIAGTLVRAISREMTLMYSQIDEAYRRAFLMQAEGVALDNVVALLGVHRNPAVNAAGKVTFGVKQPPLKPVPIPPGTQVADANGHLFATLDTDAAIGLNSQTVTVNAVALDPGPQANVAANAITIMPTPPPGVDSVTNTDAFTGGQIAEGDDALRERAQHALDRAGKGTLDAIKYAVKAIPNVEDVEVRDHTLDGTIPLGEVHVYYSGGNSPTDLYTSVQNVVNETRAAGIFATILPIGKVSIGGTFYVLPDTAMPGSAPENFRQAAIAAITALPVGGALSLRRLNALVYNVAGLKDVAEAQLTATPPGVGQFITTDPLTVQATDTLMPDIAAIKVVAVRALVLTDPAKITVAHNTVAKTYTLAFPVQLTDGAAPLAFLNFNLNINVTLTVTSKTNNSVKTIVGPYRAATAFTGDGKTAGTAMAQITVPEADLPTDRLPALSVTLAADGYPALTAVPPTDVTLGA